MKGLEIHTDTNIGKYLGHLIKTLSTIAIAPSEQVDSAQPRTSVASKTMLDEQEQVETPGREHPSKHTSRALHSRPPSMHPRKGHHDRLPGMGDTLGTVPEDEMMSDSEEEEASSWFDEKIDIRTRQALLDKEIQKAFAFINDLKYALFKYS